MHISYRWLERHVDLTDITPAALAQTLSICTAEVEGLERWAPHLSDVVIGHVVTREKHPDADKLSVCTVDVGAGEPLQIVCGAPNVRAGLHVAVATVGTELPGDFKIKKSKIRGVESVGMICSVRELELGEDHDGIWELETDAALGTPVAEALGLEDWVLEIDNKSITHRPDLWGHRGIAREIAAIYGAELKPLDLSLPKTGDASGVPVRIDDAACSRYLALEIDGVQVTKSPQWMQHLLRAVGQRPIDLLVDISNFVMLDLGQPNHLFDRKQIGEEGITVRMARAGETLTTLDEEERKLGTEDLLICTGDTPVALAGVMGGEASKVASDTTRLLLEIATFHPTVIRRTSARLGLRTDSSARFEKTLDPTLTVRAAAHLVHLLRELQPGITLPTKLTDVGDWSDPSCEVALDPNRLRRILGVEIADKEITSILRSLGFEVDAGKSGGMRVRVPSFRATKDVSIEEDLIEEVARIHGLTEIPERTLHGEVVPPPRDPRRELVRALQDRLSGGARFHEALSYSFLSDELSKQLGVAGEKYVRVINPVAEGEDRVRRGVVPSLLGLVAKNRRHRGDVRLFEIGKGTLPEFTDERGQPREIHELGLVLAAPRPGKHARFDAGCFARLRGVVEDLLVATGHANTRWEAFEAGNVPAAWAHPGRSLRLVAPGPDGAVELGLLTELEPGLHRPLGLVEELAGEVACARISLDALLESTPAERAYQPIPRFPGNKLDVALAMPSEVPCAELVKAIEDSGKGLVASVELFDVYQGESLGAGKRSMAFHVLLQSDAKTLTDADGQKFLGRLERGCERLGGELRRE
ncbi:MAG: phenylalanine--tRNA ligase subunit beta [Planctomycetes bacterium]|nr:phenylalanine--tRNA ligase subunit beta [Planctomycetota bacterium]MCB9904195.1 phenylalanine--tRNA ligase subunit beta [Planctomycetota bacterium]